MTSPNFAEIQNFTSNCRTNYLNTTYGLPNVMVTQDETGRITGMAAAGTTQWKDDGRQIATGWTITAPYTVTEVCDGVTYTWTSGGNKYTDGTPDGTFTPPTGEWVLDATAFDGLTAVTARGNTSLVEEIIIP
jgi:hypothetical protein